MDFVTPLLNLDCFGYFNIIFSKDFILNRDSPKLLYFQLKKILFFIVHAYFVISYYFTSCAY